jgi:pimeloyl-ACP methyl ester carboxylesterase
VVPLYFGTSSARLFGVYHPAESAQRRSCGIVICPPFGHEYIRAHRLLRQLAVQLSHSGFHVLRFDYLGCGDSAGEPQAGSPSQWMADIATAIDELRDTSEVRRVGLIGLRLGATLAVGAAERRDDVEAVVLWDPILDGGRHLEDLQLLQRSWLKDRPGSRQFAFQQQVSEVIGFPITAALRAELAKTVLEEAVPPAQRRIVVLDSEDHESQRQWVVKAAGEWPEVMQHARAKAGDWHLPELVHSALLANKTMLRVAGLVAENVA